MPKSCNPFQAINAATGRVLRYKTRLRHSGPLTRLRTTPQRDAYIEIVLILTVSDATSAPSTELSLNASAYSAARTLSSPRGRTGMLMAVRSSVVARTISDQSAAAATCIYPTRLLASSVCTALIRTASTLNGLLGSLMGAFSGRQSTDGRRF